MTKQPVFLLQTTHPPSILHHHEPHITAHILKPQQCLYSNIIFTYCNRVATILVSFNTWLWSSQENMMYISQWNNLHSLLSSHNIKTGYMYRVKKHQGAVGCSHLDWKRKGKHTFMDKMRLHNSRDHNNSPSSKRHEMFHITRVWHLKAHQHSLMGHNERSESPSYVTWTKSKL